MNRYLKKFGAKLHRGFSLITAIFLLVVLGTLGTMMVTFFVAQQQSSTLDVLGSRAYQAARAGIEWAAYNISITPQRTLWAGCAAVPVPLFAANTLNGNLSPFTITLTCNSVLAVEDGVNIYVYDLTSVAVNGGVQGSKDHVERSITVKMGH